MKLIRRKLETRVLRAAKNFPALIRRAIQLNRGGRRELLPRRVESGSGFHRPGKNGAITLIECKAVQTVTPAMAGSLLRLSDVMT